MKKQVVSDEFYYDLYDKIDEIYNKVFELGTNNPEAYDVALEVLGLHRWLRENTIHSWNT